MSSFGSSTMVLPPKTLKSARASIERLQKVHKDCEEWNMKGKGIQSAYGNRCGYNGNTIPFISVRSLPDDTETDADRNTNYQYEHQYDTWQHYKRPRPQRLRKDKSGPKLDLEQKIRAQAASRRTKRIDTSTALANMINPLLAQPLNTTDWDKRHASQFSTGTTEIPKNFDLASRKAHLGIEKAQSEAPRKWSPSKDTSLGRTILAIDEEVLRFKRERSKFINFAVSTVGARFQDTQESIIEEAGEPQGKDADTGSSKMEGPEIDLDAAAKELKVNANLAQYEALLEQYVVAGGAGEFKVQRTSSLPPPEQEWGQSQTSKLVRWSTQQESKSDDGMEDYNKDAFSFTSAPSSSPFMTQSSYENLPVEGAVGRRINGSRPTLPRKQLFNRYRSEAAEEVSSSGVENAASRIVRSKSHLLADQEVTVLNWFRIRSQLPNSFKYHLSFAAKYKTWTVNLNTIPPDQINKIPLYIAKCPVIATHMFSNWDYAVVQPEDPLGGYEIDPRQELPQHIVDKIFDTFPRAIDAAVLLNGILLLNYDIEFDHSVDRARSPVSFGGLSIEFTNTTTIMTSPSYSSSRASQDNKPVKPADKMQIHVPPGESNPVGSPAYIITYQGKSRKESWAAMGVRVKTLNEDHERHAVTMATHAIVTEARKEVHKDSVTGDIDGIDVYRSMESIGKVTKSFDDPGTEGNMMDYIYDVSLLATDEGKHHLLPELSFSEDGKRGSKMEWLDEPLSVLNHESTSQVVLLGADIFDDRAQRSKKRKSRHKDTYLGDKHMVGAVEFGPEELQRIMEFGNKAKVPSSPSFTRNIIESSSPPEDVALSYQEQRHPSSDPSSTGVDQQTTPSESQATSIDTIADTWYNKICSAELEGLVQGILYRERRRLSRAVLWRPDLVKPFMQFPSFAGASGCPLAVKCMEDDGSVVYKVFGFQMMQRLPPNMVREPVPDDPTDLKEEQLRMLFANQFACYGASILPRELIEKWAIVWDSGKNKNTRAEGEAATARDIVEPRSKKRRT